MRKSGIYGIRNIHNNKLYAGSSKNIPERWKEHVRKLRRGAHHSIALQRAWDKYGAEAFEFYIIEYVEPAQLIEREQYYLDTLQPEYNMSTLAAVPCVPVTEEARAKLRDAANRQWERNHIERGVTDEGKPCRTCGTWKPYSEYHHAQAKGKYYPYPDCRECDNTAKREKYRSTIGKGTWLRKDQPMPDCKPCRKCGKVKPLSDFYAKKGGLYGRDSKCKDCDRDGV